jgi:hypothetical protein
MTVGPYGTAGGATHHHRIHGLKDRLVNLLTMVNPGLAEKVVQEFIQKNGPLTIRTLKQKTGFQKCVLNSILHKNRHYKKVLRNPLGRNTRPIWSWSDTEVSLPTKIRVMSKVVEDSDLE